MNEEKELIKSAIELLETVLEEIVQLQDSDICEPYYRDLDEAYNHADNARNALEYRLEELIG